MESLLHIGNELYRLRQWLRRYMRRLDIAIAEARDTLVESDALLDTPFKIARRTLRLYRRYHIELLRGSYRTPDDDAVHRALQTLLIDCELRRLALSTQQYACSALGLVDAAMGPMDSLYREQRGRDLMNSVEAIMLIVRHVGVKVTRLCIEIGENASPGTVEQYCAAHPFISFFRNSGDY